MKTTHPLRPVAALNEITRQNSSVWKMVETAYLSKGKGDVPDWPAWCFIPLFPWRYIAAQWANLPKEKVTREILMLLASVGTWRYSQGVYRFSPELYGALSKTNLNSKIPADVLLRLPEWSVYVETPGLPWGADNTLWGFWAFLDWDVVTNITTLHITCDLAKGFEARSLELGDFSLAESLVRMIEPAIKHKPSAVVQWEAYKEKILPELIERYSLLVSLLLYICSDDPEFNGPESGASPKRPQFTKVKTGIRLFPANGPRVWHTGLEIGKRLEKERLAAELNAKERKGVKPHLRRAHWHGYWTGPRKKDDDGENNAVERKFSHRWLPPIFVSTLENADPEE